MSRVDELNYFVYFDDSSKEILWSILHSSQNRIFIDTAYCKNTSLVIELLDNDTDTHDKRNHQCVSTMMVTINYS